MPTRTKARMFETRIDLPAKKRSELVDLLNQTLADITDLSSQVHVAHWNVKGPEFFQLHQLFEELYNELNAFTDEVAERITALGGYAHGTIRNAAEASTLPEYPDHVTAGLDHVAALAERYAHFGGDVRRAIDQSDELDDKSTADLYTEISRVIDKRLWFLESHLQDRS